MSADVFGAVFIALTIAGSLWKNIIGMDVRAFNSVVLMHVDPKQYARTEIDRYLMREAFSMGIALIGMSYYLEISISVSLVFLFIYLSLHMIGEVFSMYDYARNDYQGNSSKFSAVINSSALLLCAAAIWLLISGKILISNNVAAYSAFVLVPLGILAYRILLNDFNYQRLYRYNLSVEKLFTENRVVVSGKSSVNLTAMSKSLDNRKVSGSGKGYDFLFKAFLTRYHRTFSKGLIIKMAAITVVGIAAASLPLIKSLGITGDLIIRTVFSLSRLLIYIIYWFAQAGKSFIMSCFLQIDRYLVNYSFFRRSEDIRKNFHLRTLAAMVITLIPSLYMLLVITVIGLIYGCLPETGELMLLYGMVIVLSIFYSIYEMSAYYLLQPYDFNGTIVNKAYAVVDVFVYVLAYLCLEIDFRLSAGLVIGISVIAVFASVILYAAVIRRAPSKFRVR